MIRAKPWLEGEDYIKKEGSAINEKFLLYLIFCKLPQCNLGLVLLRLKSRKGILFLEQRKELDIQRYTKKQLAILSKAEFITVGWWCQLNSG